MSSACRPTRSSRSATSRSPSACAAFGDQRLRAAAQDEVDPAATHPRDRAPGLAERRHPRRPRCRRPTAPWTCARWSRCARPSPTSRRLADTAFAMQGLGSYAVSRAGTDVAEEALAARGRARARCSRAFAVTEPEAGSDLGAACARAPSADGLVWRLARRQDVHLQRRHRRACTPCSPAAATATEHRGLSMFLVDAEAPGIAVKPLEPMAPHPLGEVRFEGTPAVLLGEEGKGYRLALATLDTFRPSVGAAACGLAARALDEALRWSQARRQFGRAAGRVPGHADGAGRDARRSWRRRASSCGSAAWLKDHGRGADPARGRRRPSSSPPRWPSGSWTARCRSTAGQGVMRGATVERLYREVRALRIYEGTSEIQKLVIARHILKESRVTTDVLREGGHDPGVPPRCWSR